MRAPLPAALLELPALQACAARPHPCPRLHCSTVQRSAEKYADVSVGRGYSAMSLLGRELRSPGLCSTHKAALPTSAAGLCALAASRRLTGQQCDSSAATP